MSKVRISAQALNTVIDWAKYKKASAARLNKDMDHLFPVELKDKLHSQLSGYPLLKDAMDSYFGLLVGMESRLYYLPHMDFSATLSKDDFIPIKLFRNSVQSVVEKEEDLLIITGQKENKLHSLKMGDQKTLPFFKKNRQWDLAKLGDKIITTNLINQPETLDLIQSRLGPKDRLHTLFSSGGDFYLHILKDDFHSLIVKTRAPEFSLDDQVLVYYPPELAPEETAIVPLEKAIQKTDTIFTPHGFLSSVNMKQLTLNGEVIRGTELSEMLWGYNSLFMLSELPLRFLVTIPMVGEIRLYTVDHLAAEVIDCTILKSPFNNSEISAYHPIKSVSNHAWLIDHLISPK